MEILNIEKKNMEHISKIRLQSALLNAQNEENISRLKIEKADNEAKLTVYLLKKAKLEYETALQKHGNLDSDN